VLNTLNFSLLLETGSPKLYYRDRPLSHYEAVIPRNGASVSAHGTAVVRQLEQMGVFALNSAQAIGTSRDKLRAAQILSRHEIAFPPTAFVRDRFSVRSATREGGRSAGDHQADRGLAGRRRDPRRYDQGRRGRSSRRC
jgi:ribosomal protein S6--L-glutamate ligase